MASGDSSSSSYPFALPADFPLEEYRIVRVLGQGGFGITYLAHDTRLATDVAIKELLPRGYVIRTEDLRVEVQRQSDDQIFAWAKQRFIQEARTLAKLNHPNIVRVFRFLEQQGTAYMVMEFVRGQPFLHWMRKHSKPTEAALKNILLPLLDGLDHVHQQRLLHRDISPENIFITERGQPVLLDFGNSRTTMDPDRKFTDVVRPGYSPIEQYQTVTHQGSYTDLYALAAVMIHAITGNLPPLSMDRLGEVDPFKPMTQRYRGSYSETFLLSLDAAFTVQPEDRLQSVSDWRRTLTGELRPTRKPRRPKAFQVAKPEVAAPKEQRKPSAENRSKPKSTLFVILLLATLIAGALAVFLSVSEDHDGFKPSPTPAPVTPTPATLRPSASLAPINKEHPYINSLGMEFVPVPGQSVLFCVHQTRKRDYEVYVKARRQKTLNEEWKNPRWRNVPVSSTDDDPVVMVSWNDAVAFCDWLSESESKNGVQRNYRLPVSDEWSAAVTTSLYPWGDVWPPPAGSGNYADLTAQRTFGAEIRDPIPGYDDGFATTAPVKSFKSNGFGLYDLGSNVQEWCGPKRDDGRVIRRGASWGDSSKEGLASARMISDLADQRSVFIGFRCVLEVPR